MYENGHRRSHVTPLIGGFYPPAMKNYVLYLRFQPIQTKFSHMTFDWNSSSELENGHQRSHVTPLIGISGPPGQFNYFFLSVTTITLERLNQSEPNFHTRLLAEIARQVQKWVSQVTCNPP